MVVSSPSDKTHISDRQIPHTSIKNMEDGFIKQITIYSVSIILQWQISIIRHFTSIHFMALHFKYRTIQVWLAKWLGHWKDAGVQFMDL
jgi:hypothetical protein